MSYLKLPNKSEIWKKRICKENLEKFNFDCSEYLGLKIDVECSCKSCGISFFRRADNFFKKTYCPGCERRQRLTLDYFLEKAKEYHGDSYDYSMVKDPSGYRKKVEIKCMKCNHVFYSRVDLHIAKEERSRSGCPSCAGFRGSGGLSRDMFLDKAKSIHGEKYDFSMVGEKINVRDYIKVICNVCKKWEEDVFIFSKRADSLLYSGSGCPRCYMKNRGFKSEIIFGKILRSIFKDNVFVKDRPNFLCYPKSNRNLELDFYCEELGIAFEVNGAQHYEFVKYFHGNMEDFKERLNKDLFKKQKCLENGITLFSFDLRNLKGNESHKRKIIKNFIKLSKLTLS